LKYDVPVSNAKKSVSDLTENIQPFHYKDSNTDAFREITAVYSVDRVTFKYIVCATFLAHLNFLDFATLTKRYDS
jgi:hypothetical protein